ncbi:hypothetical protein SNE25_09625 [Mucilaginibacter sabulilitoris]|uniref:Uncharacterized protein n=1 Tax=Mucilaginibacter sabulilitoris TaxID=1173583 RepID=A0ABZ0TYH7_9SPHI|nr:hypothetical protein [Mucilaginibacter sabulilitoris]WPU97193.1 hypothetical protein SNE25_09625 [Mucilaginibacter sabulilitoris]
MAGSIVNCGGVHAQPENDKKTIFTIKKSFYGGIEATAGAVPSFAICNLPDPGAGYLFICVRP